MCGRFNLRTNPSEFAKLFGVLGDYSQPWTPRYNIGPTQPVLCVRDGAEREFFMPKWGLIPSGAEDAKDAIQCINARSESIDTRPAFRSAFQKRRCLVIADGFYEWRAADRAPHFISLISGQQMPFAGLWETWDSPDGPIETCTICTIAANRMLGKLHNRMPVILALDAIDLWLNPKITDAKKVKPLLRQCPGPELQIWEVSKAVGDVRNQRPELMEPIDRPRTLKFQ
jgi:putative SOS response-associated peptidase YedK